MFCSQAGTLEAGSWFKESTAVQKETKFRGMEINFLLWNTSEAGKSFQCIWGKGVVKSHISFLSMASIILNVKFMGKIEIWSHTGHLLMAYKKNNKRVDSQSTQCWEIFLLDDSSLILKSGSVMTTFSVIIWGRFRSSPKLLISFLKEVAIREAAVRSSQPARCLPSLLQIFVYLTTPTYSTADWWCSYLIPTLQTQRTS